MSSITQPLDDSTMVVDPDEFEREARAERTRGTRSSNFRAIFLGISALLVFLLGWWLTWKWELVNPLFISNPVDVAKALVTMLGDAQTWGDIWATFYAAVLALAFGSVLGILTGIVFAASPAVRE